MPVWTGDDAIDAAVALSSVDVERKRWMRDDPRPSSRSCRTRSASSPAPPVRIEGAPNALPGENIHGQTWVPITDERCWVYCDTWNPDRPLTEDERRQYRAGRTVHAQVDERWVPRRNRDNDYVIDRDAQKRKPPGARHRLRTRGSLLAFGVWRNHSHCGTCSRRKRSGSAGRPRVDFSHTSQTHAAVSAGNS